MLSKETVDIELACMTGSCNAIVLSKGLMLSKETVDIELACMTGSCNAVVSIYIYADTT